MGLVALTALLSFLLTGLATWYARFAGVLAHPGERHSHTETTPRGGGAGLVLALLIVSLVLIPERLPEYWPLCVAPGFIAVALVGWWDDHRSLSARFRFAVQLAACVYLLWCAADSGRDSFISLALAGLYLLWMTNLYNFMDGSNGMAGCQGVFAAGIIAWLFMGSGDQQSAWLAFLVAAVCLGFLPWNLGQARVFMGDVGSLSLGYILAALSLYGVSSGAFSLPVALMVMAIFLTDSTLTLLSRVLRRERWYNAHRQHLYQRLIANGWTHGRAVLFYQVINLTLVLPAILVAAYSPAFAWPLALVMALVFGLGWYLLTKRIGVLA